MNIVPFLHIYIIYMYQHNERQRCGSFHAPTLQCLSPKLTQRKEKHTSSFEVHQCEDNQNHAIIFLRGIFSQCIDANQGGYFEQMPGWGEEIEWAGFEAGSGGI